VIDLHSHILPGLDDGAASPEESVELARAAVRDGVRVMAATPHVRADYPTSPEDMERALRRTQEALRDADVPLEVVGGGELALDVVPDLGDDALRRFGLGGNPRYLLLEFPYGGWPLSLETQVFELRTRDVTPVLAHPERNVAVQAAPERLARTVEEGALVQLTASSVTGGAGSGARKTAARLLELELAHLVAADWHGSNVPRASLPDACSAIGDARLARWLTEHVPQAILGDLPVPARPRRAPRRLGRWRRH
jgi:protein-tyrosine phosphatase